MVFMMMVQISYVYRVIITVLNAQGQMLINVQAV